jgi:hypothetical protein
MVLGLTGCLITEDEARSWAEDNCYYGICEGDEGWPGEADRVYSGTGQVTVQYTEEGSPTCDGDFELSGASFDAGCEACSLSLEVDSTLTNDDSDSGCDWDDLGAYTLRDERGDTIRLIGYAPELGTTSGSYSEAFWSGYVLPEDTSALVFEYILEDDAEDATTSWDGSTLTWTSTYGGYVTSFTGDAWQIDTCGGSASGGSGDAPNGGQSFTEDLPCETVNSVHSTRIDIWEFEVDGPEVTIAVDTLSESTAADLSFWLIDDMGCTDYVADDEFPCSYDPVQFECPALSASLNEGHHRLAVRHFNSCRGDTAEYRLLIEGDVDDVSLLHDDMHQLDFVWTDISVLGRMELTTSN